MNQTWGLVGLGWLGKRLQSQLQLAGISTWGTRTDSFRFEKDAFPGEPCDILLLNTPPLTQLSPQAYVEKIKLGKNSKIIFISSTSVYGNAPGNFNESSQTIPVTPSACWLLEVESLLREQFAERLLIIRPGGLIGGERHPVFTLSQKGIVTNANHSINFIHRDDLVEIIMAASHSGEKLVAAVTPYHPSKEIYYRSWVKKLNLTMPEFHNSPAADRVIDSVRLKEFYVNWRCPLLDLL